MSILSTPTMVIGDVIAGEGAKVRGQLETLISSVTKSTFDIGALLSRVKNGKFYVSWGFNTFREYVDTIELKPRKAQYLVRIYDVMDQVGVERKVYEPLGLAKLREITSLDPDGKWTNPENGEETPLRDFIVGFVERAGTLSLEDIRQHVRTLKGLVGENDLVWENYCIKRSVHEEIVNKAKELARRNLGTKGRDEEGEAIEYSDGACLEAWCVEYLNDPNNNILAEETE